MRKTSTRGRVAGFVAAVVIGLVGAIGAVYFTGGGGGAETGTFTPVNRDLSLSARDVMKAIQEWQQATMPAPEPSEEGEGGAAPAAAEPVDIGTGPLELTVVVREREVGDLPDDLTIAVCPDVRAWLNVMSNKGYVPLVAARSPSKLGSHVVLYDGQSVETVSASKAPMWAGGAGAGAGGIEFTKKDLAEGVERAVTFTR